MPEGPALIAYQLSPHPMPLVPAPLERAWMEASDVRFAYRCLPMLLANQAGWHLLNDAAFECCWDGGSTPTSLQVRATGNRHPTALSHFGLGLLTWHMPYLFRTSPGWNLLVRGPANLPKDGVQALEGLVETDWAVATFTMNWQVTRRDVWIPFAVGEPICCILPQRRGDLEATRPAVRPLDADPALAEAHRAWAESRARFLGHLQRGALPRSQQWQKHYFQGRTMDGTAVSAHQTTLKLRPFVQPNDPTA
jgi:hypothetical protein